MKTLMTISVVLLLTGFLGTDLMAQRGGRGQGQQGNRNNQSAQQGQGRRGFGQNATGQNRQQQQGRGQAGQSQNGRGQAGQSQNGRGQRGNGRGQSSGTPTAQERNDLTLMREEEKLARDVYIALNKKWGATIFANISRAESKHMQAIAGLLNRYRIPDPVVSNTPGTFTNPRFQQLYQSLVNEGSVSGVEALKVGLKIEEMDIADLRVAIQASNKNDIKQVLQNLEQGSRNHLRAFASQLQQAGGTYVSTQLSQNEFNEIASSTPGRGGNQGRQGNQAQGQRRQGQGNGRVQRGRGNAQGSGGNKGKGQGGKGRGR
jgi:hypothetical protein